MVSCAHSPLHRTGTASQQASCRRPQPAVPSSPRWPKGYLDACPISICCAFQTDCFLLYLCCHTHFILLSAIADKLLSFAQLKRTGAEGEEQDQEKAQDGCRQ